MTEQSNDRKQLKGMLREFDLGLANEVLGDLCSDLMPKVSEFTNQGEKCSPGHDGCLGKEESVQAQEAVWGQNPTIREMRAP